MVRWSPLGASSGDEYPTPPQAKSISWTLPGGEYTPPGYSALGTYPQVSPLGTHPPPLDIPTHPQKGPGTMVTHLPRRDLEPWLLWLLTPPPRKDLCSGIPLPQSTDTRLWKHYLPATSLAGSKKKYSRSRMRWGGVNTSVKGCHIQAVQHFRSPPCYYSPFLYHFCHFVMISCNNW